MNKKILLSIATYIAVIVLLYLCISFVKMDFDVTKWSLESRGVLVTVGSLLAMIPISAIWIFGLD